jgi:hypothetical protein
MLVFGWRKALREGVWRIENMAVRATTRKKKVVRRAKAGKAVKAVKAVKRPANCAGCPVRDQQSRMISELIERLGVRLQGDEGKGTVGDYIRLLQLRKELDEQQPREIRVTWVKSAAKKSKPDK